MTREERITKIHDLSTRMNEVARGCDFYTIAFAMGILLRVAFITAKLNKRQKDLVIRLLSTAARGSVTVADIQGDDDKNEKL